MITHVSKGHTLLIKGPARITLVEGKIEVFGKIFIPEEEKSSSEVSNLNGILIVPSAHSYPIYAVEKSKL
ncbi:MAG: hypothetical protein JSV62_08740, partial [Promethearchaeota archaeon]